MPFRRIPRITMDSRNLNCINFATFVGEEVIMDGHGGMDYYVPLNGAKGKNKQHTSGHDCFCNFFRKPTASEEYKAPKEYVELLRLLSNAMSHQPRNWKKPLSQSLETWENPNIPSGYTYLAQMVAHDLVQTSVNSPNFSNDHDAFKNNRTPVLDLDTLYGSHPRAARHAYAVANRGDRLRTRLRIGEMKASGGTAQSEAPPLRDIGRMPAPHGNGIATNGLSEPCLADSRNDNNSNLSQLLTVFVHLHNGVIDCIERLQPQVESMSFIEWQERSFTDARQIVERIYRSVVRNDLMKRLINPNIYKHYDCEKPQFINNPAERQMTLEFSQAVFRFGHAMIRPSYHMANNKHEPRTINEILLFTSANRPWQMPLDESWIIDWSEYFDLGFRKPRNLSCRIGPNYSGNLVPGKLNRLLGSGDNLALGHRDLLRGATVGIWSVNALIDALMEKHGALFKKSKLSLDAEHRSSELTKWLVENTEILSNNKAHKAAIKAFSEDPPLAFYVLFESAQECNGEHLGTLGSIIVADTVFNALDAGKLDIENEQRIDDLMSGVFGEATITTVPELLRATAALSGLFATTPPFLF